MPACCACVVMTPQSPDPSGRYLSLYVTGPWTSTLRSSRERGRRSQTAGAAEISTIKMSMTLLLPHSWGSWPEAPAFPTISAKAKQAAALRAAELLSNSLVGAAGWSSVS